MYHDIFPLLQHILIREDVILNDVSIVLAQIVNELLTVVMSQSIGHFIPVNPVFTELFSFFLDFGSGSLRLDLFEDDVVLHDFLVLEQYPLDLVQGVLGDLELVGDGLLLVCLLVEVLFDD